MAVKSTVVSVGTAATLLADATLGTATSPASALVSVPSGGVIVYIGGPDVTTANGFPVAAGTTGPALDLVAGDSLYGVVASGTQNANVLRLRV